MGPGTSIESLNEEDDDFMRFRFSRARKIPRKALALFSAGVLSVSVVASGAAVNISGFEIDADNAPANALSGYYSGNDPTPGDDWADGGPNNGVFQLGLGGDPDFANCYGSDISVSAGTAGASTLICDGTSNSGFTSVEPEQSIVSPSGKTPDDVWPIKPGNNTPKNDITHGYVSLLTTDSVCDDDDGNGNGLTGAELADDLIVRVAGERLNNEGDSFWGFEFDQLAPTGFSNLVNNTGASFNLNFNRSLNDVLLSVSLERGGTVPTIEVFKVTGFVTGGSDDGDAIFTGPQASTCPLGGSAITSQGVTNGTADLRAPPWKVLVCDPSATNGSNSCRLVNQAGTGTVAGDTNIPPRDFIEAAIDLTQFGIAAACFNNVLFTSRSSSSITADLKDVGGGVVPLCAVTVATEVHNAAHQDITNQTITTGTVVHDKAIVTGTISGGVGPTPTGTVDFLRFDNLTCSGTPVSTENNVPLLADGTAESSTFVATDGPHAYTAHYDGDTNYGAADGPCEPFTAINPSTLLSKTATVSTTVTYVYTETNDGTSPLTSVFVSDPTCQAAAIRVTGDTNSDGILDPTEDWSGDTDDDGILDPGETWNFTCTKTFNGPGTFINTASGHATDPIGRDVTFCDDPTTPPTGVFCDQQERDSVTVGVTVSEAAGP